MLLRILFLYNASDESDVLQYFLFLRIVVHLQKLISTQNTSYSRYHHLQAPVKFRDFVEVATDRVDIHLPPC